MDTSSSQVRIESSSSSSSTTQSYRMVEEPVMVGSSQVVHQYHYDQHQDKVNPIMGLLQDRNVPIEHSPVQQQHVLQHHLSHQSQNPALQHQQLYQEQQQQQNLYRQAQPTVREFNVPIQMTSNPSTPQPSVVNPVSESFQPLFSSVSTKPQLVSMHRALDKPSNLTNEPERLSQQSKGQANKGQGVTNQDQGYQKGPASGMQFEGIDMSGATEWPPQQSGSEGNLTTVYPSNFKLRNEMPVQQEPAKVFSSQPAFKSTKPIRMRGDSKWPPTQGSSEDTSQEQQVREFIKPRKQCKDYSTFFAQNALPSSYTGYRAPPGTQHVGVSDEDAVDM